MTIGTADFTCASVSGAVESNAREHASAREGHDPDLDSDSDWAPRRLDTGRQEARVYNFSQDFLDHVQSKSMVFTIEGQKVRSFGCRSANAIEFFDDALTLLNLNDYQIFALSQFIPSKATEPLTRLLDMDPLRMPVGTVMDMVLCRGKRSDMVLLTVNLEKPDGEGVLSGKVTYAIQLPSEHDNNIFSDTESSGVAIWVLKEPEVERD